MPIADLPDDERGSTRHAFDADTVPILSRRRHAIVGAGRDCDGTPSIAAWSLSCTGEPLAGWVFPAQQALHDPAVAHRLVTAVAGSVLCGLSDDVTAVRAAVLLDRLAVRAGSLLRHRRRRVVEPALVLTEIEQARRELARPCPLPPVPSGSPADLVGRVLLTARTLRWCVQSWRTVESARGGSRAFPPYWQEQMSAGGPLRRPPADR